MSMVNLNVRVDAEVKQRAEALFNSLGLNMSTAVNVFLRQSLETNIEPIAVRSETHIQVTLEAMRETEDILAGRKKVKQYASAAELFRDLDAEEDDAQ